jgi:folate-binding protein YgfZ
MADSLQPNAAVLADYERLTEAMGVIAWPDRTVLEVTGKDRATFLHNFCTNEIKKLPIGSGCEAFLTSVQGKTLGHAFIAAEAERLLIATGAGQASPLLAHFDKYLISEDVAFRDLSDTLCKLMAVGPVVRDGLPGAVAHWFAWGGFASLPAQCAFVARDLLPLTLETLTAAGLPHCSPEAWEMVRIEQRFPKFGTDFGEDNLPQELARDAQAISFTKGCYLGQETVARIDAMGHVNQVLAGIRFLPDAKPNLGASLLAGEKIVGKLTSLAWSPKLAAPLGLAIVRRGAAAVGNQLTLPDGNHATVVELPL